MSARIAVFVSGGGTNLQAILDAKARGEIKSGEIVLVCASNENAYALTRAENAGIETYVSQKREGEKRKDAEKRLLDFVIGKQIDLIVLAGFLTILSADFTGNFPGKIINVHPALIPAFCGKGFYGLKVHEAVLEKGVKITGATVHYVNEIPDGGEIIFQKAVEVYEGDTPEILQSRVMREAEWSLRPRAVEYVSKLITSEEKNA
ncbi:MAG: phosphoribosylglycinamide formyltransferase [Clostridia bacterium]|nr:phosphoribosylglycinamide formyltransferase [Clostridia bacterium]